MALPQTIFPEISSVREGDVESPITEDILNRLRQVESGGGRYLVSPKGALGPYQLMPATAAEYGVDPMREPEAREAARKILEKNYEKYGDLNLALMAYHAGQGNVDRYLAGEKSQVGPLTQAYPEKIMAASTATPSDKVFSYLPPNPFQGLKAPSERKSSDEIFSYLPPNPFGAIPEAPAKEAPKRGAFMRGLETEWEQTKALIPGLAGLVGATGENLFGEGGKWSDLKNWGLSGYQTRMKQIGEKAEETDDAIKAWEKAKEGDLGALLEWGKYGLGYLTGNIAEAVVTGGVGSLAGKAAFKTAGEGILKNMVAKEAAKLAEKEAAEAGVVLGAKELAERAAAPEIIEAATKTIAGRVGSVAALSGAGITKETGSIYGEAEEEAAEKGRKLDGADLARIWGSGIVAGLSEAAVDRLGLDVAAGRIKIPGTGRVGSALVGATLGAGVEGGQEFLQTVIERYGAAKELTGDDAFRDYVNSTALGALGGGTVGGVIGALRGKKISEEEAKAALDRAKQEFTARGDVDPDAVKIYLDEALERKALPAPEEGKYGPDYGFTRRDFVPGEGLDVTKSAEERIADFRARQEEDARLRAEEEQRVAEERPLLGFERTDEEGRLRGEGFTMRGAEEEAAPRPEEKFEPAGLLGTRIRDVEPLTPRETAETRLAALPDGEPVTKSWLSENAGVKGQPLDNLWKGLIGDKLLRREGNKFVRNAPEERPALPPPAIRLPDQTKIVPEYNDVERSAVSEKYLPIGKKEPRTQAKTIGKPTKPRNIIEWIADTGGIWDSGGELTAMGLNAYRKPGLRRVVIGKGRDDIQSAFDPQVKQRNRRDPDYVRMNAIEAGYLSEDATLSDLYEAIDETMRGRPAYSVFDLGEIQDRADQKVAAEARREERRLLEQDAAIYGIAPGRLTDKTLRAKIADAEAKVEREERLAYATERRLAKKTPPAEEFIPFDEPALASTEKTSEGKKLKAEAAERRPAEEAPKALPAPEAKFSRDIENPPTVSKLVRQEKLSDTLTTQDFENPRTYDEQKVRVTRAVQSALEKVLGPGADIRVVDQVLGKFDGEWHSVGGAFEPIEKVIALSMQAPDIGRAGYHEAVHFLREANVISDADWKLLSDQAEKWKNDAYKSTWKEYKDLKKRESRIEEVIADAFSDWRNGRLDVPNPILRIFHKVLDFLQALKDKIGQRGARTWRDVFTDIERGKYRDQAGRYHMTEMTPNGAFNLVDSRTGNTIGEYQTKGRAIEAALQNEEVANSAARISRESDIAIDDAAQKVSANHTPEQMAGIAQRQAMYSLAAQAEPAVSLFNKFWGKVILPVALAAKDKTYARLWNHVKDREKFTARLYQDYFAPMRVLSKLSVEEKERVYKALAAARLNNRDIVANKSNLSIAYEGDDVVDNKTNKVWLKANEKISLSKDGTEAFFALKNSFTNAWRDQNNALAVNMGFTGSINDLRIAALGDEAQKEAFLNKYRSVRGIDEILNAMTAGIARERVAYVPFQRYGNVMIAVTERGAEKGAPPKEVILVDAESLNSESVKKAVKALKARYGDTVDVQAPHFVRDDISSRASLDEVEHLINRLEKADSKTKGQLYKDYLENVQEEFKRGWQRRSKNILGFSTDFDKVIPEYLSNIAQTTGRLQYEKPIMRQLRDMNGSGPGAASPSVRRFANTWIDYIDNPSNDYSNTRKLGFLWHLWGNLSSAVVNLSQTPLVSIPILAKWGMNPARGTAEATKILSMFANKNVYYIQEGRLLLDVDKLPLNAREKVLIKDLQEKGVLQNQVTNDQAGLGYLESVSNKKFIRNAEKAFQAGASPFALAETINRVTAALLAYRSAVSDRNFRAKATKAYAKNEAFMDRFDGGRTLTPEAMAEWFVEETQDFGGKINTPEMMRGIGSVAFQFKGYTVNYINLMYRSLAGEGRENKIAGLAMLGGLLLASGLRGIPFEGDLEKLMNWITETVTGINPNINMQLKEFFRTGFLKAGASEEFSRLGAALLMNGGSRLTSVDLGARFGQGDIVPNDIQSVFGPVVSVFSGIADGVAHIKNGQDYQGASRLVPRGVGNVIEALGYTDQGVKTRAGNEVIGPNELSSTDMALKALGFQPSKIAERQELAYDLTQVSEQARRAAGGMARYLANMVVRAESARARGDTEAAEEAMQNYADKLRQYEREMSDPDRPAYMQYKINRDALKKEIRNALDWRMRFLGGKKLARPEIIEILRRSGESIGA